MEGCLYNSLENYLHGRKQSVVLCGQSSSWLNANAGVPKGSVLGPLLFLIYINDLPENLVSVTKLLADDAFIFSTVYDKPKTSMDLNQDLSTIQKMSLSMENVQILPNKPPRLFFLAKQNLL